MEALLKKYVRDWESMNFQPFPVNESESEEGDGPQTTTEDGSSAVEVHCTYIFEGSEERAR